MWQKNDEMMGFKAISDPKQFDKCQTVMWKRKGEKGYFVTVHTPDKKATLTKLKYHCEAFNNMPIEITPFLFDRMCKRLELYSEIDESIVYDVTSTSPLFIAFWTDVLSKVAFVDYVPWSDDGMRFMVSMMLDAKFESDISNPEPEEKTASSKGTFEF